MKFRGIKCVVKCVIESWIPHMVDRNKYKYMYGIRHSDSDWSKPVTVEPTVCVNRYGYMLCEKELDMGKSGYININGGERRQIINEVEQ